MRKIILSFSFLAFVVAFAACKKSSNSTPTTAQVMFVNGCAGAAGLSVAANSVAVSSASNIQFQKNTGYTTVTAGSGINMAVSITSSGLVTPLISQSVNLTAGGNYSVYVGGIFTSPTFVYATDDRTAPAAGFAKVRFVNLSSDALNESCYIGSQKVDSNVASATATPFFQVTAASAVNVLFQDPANPTKLVNLSNQTFSSGGIYTIMITGTSTAAVGSASVLALTVINNN
jgi:hypothetical protein